MFVCWFWTEIDGNPGVFVVNITFFWSLTPKIYMSPHSSMWSFWRSILKWLFELHMQSMACLHSFLRQRTRINRQLRPKCDFQAPNVFKKNACFRCLLKIHSERGFWDADSAKTKNVESLHWGYLSSLHHCWTGKSHLLFYKYQQKRNFEGFAL